MKKPSAPNLYPELPVEDGQNYRLTKISEIEKILTHEKDKRLSLYKKYKRGVNITDGLDTGMITSSVVVAGVGLAVPIVLPLTIAAAVCGSLGVCVKFIRRKLTSKSRKHYEIKTIAEAKLNSIKDLISKALTDGQINESEFKLVLDELDKYNKLKENIHSKQVSVVLNETEKTKLIEEGKAQALSELKKKIVDH